MSQKIDELLIESSGINPEPVKVMLAEDDVDDQEFFRAALEQTDTNTELQVFNNGNELVENLKDPDKENPDLIFLDLNMPLQDGRETLKEIKSDNVLKEIPTVVLSTSDNPSDVKRSFDAGASLYVEKPNSFRSLVLVLKKIFFFHWAGQLLGPALHRFFLSEKNVHKKF